MSKWIIVGSAVVLLLIITIALIAVLIGPVAGWLAGEQGTLSDKEFADVQASARDTLLKAAAGIILLAGAIGTVGTLFYTAQTARSDQLQAGAAQSEARIARDGFAIDRFATAVGQLEASRMGERIGGIYALKGVMNDYHPDQPIVLDALTAFIREAARRPDSSNPPPDIQLALTVIASRSPRWDRGEQVNLYNAYLYNAEAHDAQLPDAELGAANMGGIDLSGADLHKTDLGSADLSGSNLNHADLTDANLSDYANLSGAELMGANLQGANLSTTNLSGANLRGADLQDTRGLTRKQIATAKLNGKTKLPSGL
jgi:hypothetical protein